MSNWTLTAAWLILFGIYANGIYPYLDQHNYEANLIKALTIFTAILHVRQGKFEYRFNIGWRGNVESKFRALEDSTGLRNAVKALEWSRSIGWCYPLCMQFSRSSFRGQQALGDFLASEVTSIPNSCRGNRTTRLRISKDQGSMRVWIRVPVHSPAISIWCTWSKVLPDTFI